GLELVGPWGARKPGRAGTKDKKQQDGAATADQPTLQTEKKKMPLELADDEAVTGADQVQNFDDGAVRRHGAAGGKRHRQDGRGEHQYEYDNASDDRAVGHGT